jgi:hypothetical protein
VVTSWPLQMRWRTTRGCEVEACQLTRGRSMPTCRRSKHGARWKHANSHEIEAWHKVEARQLAWCHRPCTPTHHPTSHLAPEKGKGEVRYRRREREGRVGDERVRGRKKVMELTGRGVQIRLEKTKIHWIEILGQCNRRHLF